MKAGSLFLDIGIKGDDKFRNVAVAAKMSLGGMRSEGLAAKAAIVGAVYGLEQLMHKSMMAGNAILNFNALTGTNTKTLQQWAGAMENGGMSAADAAATIYGIQKKMGELELSGSMPRGIQLMNKTLLESGRSQIDWEKMKTDQVYLMERAVEFAKLTSKSPNIAAANQILENLGLGGGATGLARRGFFDPSQLAKVPFFSQGQLNQQDSTRQGFVQLFRDWEMFVGKNISGAHGKEIVATLLDVSRAILDITKALLDMGEKFKIFKLMGEVAHGVSGFLHGSAEEIRQVTKGLPEILDAMGDIRFSDLMTSSKMPAFAGGAGLGSIGLPRAERHAYTTNLYQTNNLTGIKEENMPKKIGEKTGSMLPYNSGTQQK